MPKKRNTPEHDAPALVVPGPPRQRVYAARRKTLAAKPHRPASVPPGASRAHGCVVFPPTDGRLRANTAARELGEGFMKSSFPWGLAVTS